MLRSAKQAGFFEHAADRLVKPAIKQEAPTAGKDDQRGDGGREKDQNNGSSGGGFGGGGCQHPLIQGLLMTLPEPGNDWPTQERINWLTMAASIFKMIYTDQAPSSIQITSNGDPTSAS